MRIALVVPGGVDPGGERRVIPSLLWLIERVARRHDVEVFALNQDPSPCSYELRGAVVHNLAVGRLWPRALGAIIRHHWRDPFDVIHALWTVPEGTLAGLAGRILRIPVVTHLHGGELAALPEIGYGSQLHWKGRLWTQLSFRWAQKVTAHSAFMLQAAAEWGVEADWLPLGVALDRWPPSPPERRDPRKPARLAHVGTLNPVKDQGMLLRAAAELRRRGVGFRLDIVGEDTMNGALQGLAAELDLTGEVCFHGFLTQQELRPIFEAAHLLLVTSRHEAGPMVLLEAAVAGVPAVGTAVGHLVDWAPDAAVMVPVGDAAGLARETEALLADEERRLTLAREAHRRALRFDADWSAGQILEMYDRLSGAGPAPAEGRIG